MSDEQSDQFKNFSLCNCDGDYLGTNSSGRDEVGVGWMCAMNKGARLSDALVEASNLAATAFWQMVEEANGNESEYTVAWFQQVSAMISYVCHDNRIRNALLQARLETIDKLEEPETIELMGHTSQTWHCWFDNAIFGVGYTGEVDIDKWRKFNEAPVRRKLEWELARATRILGDATNEF